LQLIANGRIEGFEEQMLASCLQFLAGNKHLSMAVELQRSPALFAATVLGSMAQGKDEPFRAIKDASHLLRALHVHLPGIAAPSEEVVVLLNAVLQMSEGEVRSRIIKGLAMKVSFFV
jgi:hypothetical protein